MKERNQSLYNQDKAKDFKAGPGKNYNKEIIFSQKAIDKLTFTGMNR